jgi:integrase
MAWWQRQRGQFVYVYYRTGGHITALPRASTKHLDSLNDIAINIWLSDWQLKRQKMLRRPKPVEKYVERYCKFLKDRGRAPKTIWEHRRSLQEYVLPYFLERQPVLENPNQWPSRSLKFSDYMLGTRKQSVSSCRKAVTALRFFYRFLEEEGLVYTGIPMRVRCPPRLPRDTPLMRVVSPEEVLAFARTADPDVGLMAVIGYFFSLRTYEVMALRPADFIAGSNAQTLESCRVMRRFGQFDRLVVRIHRQRTGDGEFREPKRASFGHVACFNRAAAEWLVGRLNERARCELLFPYLPDVNIKKWKRYGIPGVTMKDLRRASLYFLGHHAGVELIALKGHARHRFATTTELYLRRPAEVGESIGPLLDLAS